MAQNVLKLENITMQFGGVVAVKSLSLEVNKGEIVSLIGPNGAGKTTAFNVITGVYSPTNGAVYFNGKKIVENHPRGKMKKLYAAKKASITVISNRPRTKLQNSELRALFRTFAFGKARAFLTMS